MDFFGQTQWREGGEMFGQEVLRWWSVKRRGAKAVGKTHILELSSLVHSIHTGCFTRFGLLRSGAVRAISVFATCYFDALLKHRIGNPSEASGKRLMPTICFRYSSSLVNFS